MSNDYGKQTADLIEDAFKNLSRAHKAMAKGASQAEVHALQIHATLQVQTAQAAATLGLATEVRAVGLLLAAGRAVTPSPEVAGEAYTAAAIMLGLVEEEPDTSMADALRDAFKDNDPADAEVEL